MTQSGHDKMQYKSAISAAAICLCLAVMACTPATGDTAGTGGAGQPGSGGAPMATATGGIGAGSGGTGAGDSGGSGGIGAGNPGGSGGIGAGNPGGSGGIGAGNSGGSGGGVGSGGAAVGGSVGTGGLSAGGTGGKVGATGGSTGSGGAAGSAAIGCNWVHNPDNTWAFGTPAPADKIVLFDGTTKSGWHKLNQPTTPIDWMLLADGTLRVVPSGTGQATEIQSNMKFDDVCVHVEYMTPPPPYRNPTDVQTWGNSGVYLKSAYELQILDSHTLAAINDGCGAVYLVSPPLVVACNMYSVWNTYEIEFKSSGWTGTTKTKDAVFVRVALNGKLVQMNQAVPVLSTKAGINDLPGPQPLGLQDHLDYVSFRNIWATIPRY